ncbi:MAG: hypothetical protein U0802_08475 [Candidatus Binatia bacterium]
MWINDARVDQYTGLKPDWDAQLAGLVADLGAHPALDGYFIIDEPGRDQFADLGLVVTRLRQLDPTRVPYINLLPDYVSPAAWGTPPTPSTSTGTWPRSAALLSVDVYPFQESGDRPSYFANLALIRDRARAAGIPGC